LLIVLLIVPNGLSFARPTQRPALATMPEQQAATLLASMTLEQKIGQMFMVSAYGSMNDTTAAFLRDVMPGGVALFGSNGTTADQVTTTVNDWQTILTQTGAKIPLLVATDQEGGPVTRLSVGFTTFPAGPALSAMPPADTRTVGGVVGAELAAVGINTDLAPVTDVKTIISNPIMDGRSFGSDPARVGDAAAAFVAGLNDSGVIGVLKHFPGHGDATDSHVGLPTVTDSLATVETVELESFRRAIKAGAEVVMVGHLVYPALDSVAGRPASISPVVIGDVLRGQLGFNGVAMTDALDMGAVILNYSPEQAAVLSVSAGIDMVTTGPHLPVESERAMYQALLDAVRNGTIPQARIDEAVSRILTLKARHGLLTWKALDVTTAGQRVNADAHFSTLQAAFAHQITVARDDTHLLPIGFNRRVVLAYPGIYPGVALACGAHDSSLQSYSFTQAPGAAEIANINKLAQNADVTLVFTYDAIDQPQQQALVKVLPLNKTVVIALHNPYDYTTFPKVTSYVLSYTPTQAAFVAVCDVLYGAATAVGVLPVTLTPDLRAGSGLPG
jgi:beta-N-acetylhexosaminidase